MTSTSILAREQLALSGPFFAELLQWGPGIRTLFHSPHSVSCLLRALPTPSRHLIFRLLYIPSSKLQPLPPSSVQCLVKATALYDISIAQLVDLHILVRRTQAGDVGYYLDAAFAEQLRRALSFGFSQPFQAPLNKSPKERPPTPQQLEKHAFARWEAILYFLVGMKNTTSKVRPSSAIVQSFKRIGLLERDKSDERRITNAGFQFLLKDPFAQTWALLWEVISYTAGTDISRKAQMLLLLFQLSFTVPGKACPIMSLSRDQEKLLDILYELGLVYINPDERDWFYPTKVGTLLVANSGTDAEAGAMATGHSLGTCEVVVETNFCVYAYTMSDLQVSLISMFVHMRTRLPNLAVGQLTNLSVREALQNGLTADQIIGYLNSHSSARCKNGRIPLNVSQMIRLWEAEEQRVHVQEAVLFEGFIDSTGHELVRAFAQEVGALLWSSVKSRMVLVSRNAREAVLDYIREKRIQ